jgi:hypothetical protein
VTNKPGCLYCSKYGSADAKCRTDDKCSWVVNKCRPTATCSSDPTSCPCDNVLATPVLWTEKTTEVIVVVDLKTNQHVDSVQLHVKEIPVGLTSIKVHGTSEYGPKWHGKTSATSKIAWDKATKKERCYSGRVNLPLTTDGRTTLKKEHFGSSSNDEVTTQTFDEINGGALFYCNVNARYIVLTLVGAKSSRLDMTKIQVTGITALEKKFPDNTVIKLAAPLSILKSDGTGVITSHQLKIPLNKKGQDIIVKLEVSLSWN